MDTKLLGMVAGAALLISAAGGVSAASWDALDGTEADSTDAVTFAYRIPPACTLVLAEYLCQTADWACELVAAKWICDTSFYTFAFDI